MNLTDMVLKNRSKTQKTASYFFLYKVQNWKILYGVSSDDSSHLGEDLKEMRWRLRGNVRKPLDCLQHPNSYNLYDDNLDIHSDHFRGITQVFCTV